MSFKMSQFGFSLLPRVYLVLVRLMALKVDGFRMSFMLKDQYTLRCEQPASFDVESTLNLLCTRWSDLPPKQCQRLRLGGSERLGLSNWQAVSPLYSYLYHI